MAEHPIDAIRAEDAFSSKLGYEEHIPGQTRDWNEELQTTRELPRKNLPERLLRERAIFKVKKKKTSKQNKLRLSSSSDNCTSRIVRFIQILLLLPLVVLKLSSMETLWPSILEKKLACRCLYGTIYFSLLDLMSAITIRN